ncbi:MFS general substrate transporter [Guyanagaster necrorhizus]|uniref:MFS general substrate transporter n=1 Tax=Guyanagaster necrorhizus TaxID=856835 RepID=A0A9P7VS13_9AGAR|nr:MFS general substrate transporter [Guyanagaster necrorhizus MCA 3950]KAG7445645.1 MFS general substrate transporter [Guyanagaster necrorhizus MCA 3950]
MSSTRTQSIELSNISHRSQQPEEDHVQLNESSLAPVDRGFDAWSFLLAAFVVEGVVWGFPDSFGVFLDSYLYDPKFMNQPHASSLLPLIGPLSSGMIFCSGPLIFPINIRYPYYRRTMMWIGVFLCGASLFGASFATKVPVLIGLQGILYAIGGSLLYAPCISYMTEWFVMRRGLASGVIFAGTSAGGLILPLVLPTLISRYGSAKALRIISIVLTTILIPIVASVKPRLPESRNRAQIMPPRSRDWMSSTTFWVLLAVNTVQGLGYFVPVVWLPTFAHEMNLSSTSSSLAVALLNGASLLSRLSLGYLADRLNPWLLALSTLTSTSIATFILWGLLSRNLAGLISFGIAYGVLAGGWSSLWTGLIAPIAKEDPNLVTYLIGYLMLSRGVGNILCTPISSTLAAASQSAVGKVTTGFQVAGGRFESMILYVGSCFAGAAGVALLGWALDARAGRARSRAS